MVKGYAVSRPVFRVIRFYYDMSIVKISTLIIIHEDMINHHDTHFEWTVISHRLWTHHTCK